MDKRSLSIMSQESLCLLCVQFYKVQDTTLGSLSKSYFWKHYCEPLSILQRTQICFILKRTQDKGTCRLLLMIAKAELAKPVQVLQCV